MDNKYIHKYLKYKKKYLDLKGGVNVFYEAAFPSVINYCKKFNKIIHTMNGGRNLIAHIKGGSSIKYHLMKRGINTHAVTDDFDLLLIKPDNMTDNDALNYFTSGLQQELSSYLITQEGVADGRNKFFKICLGGTCIIDLTIYQNDPYNDDETNMFSYAAKSTSFSNTHDYVSKLVGYYVSNLGNLTDEVIEKVTFTSLQFEYYSSLKGLELQGLYINKYETGVWARQLAEYQSKNNPMFASAVASLQRQTTPAYLARLKDKQLRYTQKISIIRPIIGV
jgi:hypothetical protein